MSTPISRTTRWRRALAAGAALTLPFGVAACSDDGNDDPDVVNEENVEDEVEDEVDDLEEGADELGEDVEEGAEDLGDEIEEGTDELEQETDENDDGES